MLPNNLTTPAFALLAFLVAFYALLARERKTPYITTFIYSAVFWVILSTLLSTISPIFKTIYPLATTILDWVALCLIVLAFSIALYNVWRLHNRHVHFRDDNLFKNLTVVRKLRHFARRIKPGSSYEHTPPQISTDALLEALKGCVDPLAIALCGKLKTLPTTESAIAISLCRQRLADSTVLLVRLIRHLLESGWLVQYTTCARHPHELVAQLQKDGILRRPELPGHIVVIDAYTPHFGFTDSIHEVLTVKIQELGIDSVRSAPSYAGVHTATAKAFNTLKVSAGGRARKPTLVIYEGTSALIDLESPEQYRLFVRHVMPSERSWGGMVTVFVEPTLSDSDASLLDSYSDVFCDRRSEEQRTDPQTGT